MTVKKKKKSTCPFIYLPLDCHVIAREKALAGRAFSPPARVRVEASHAFPPVEKHS